MINAVARLSKTLIITHPLMRIWTRSLLAALLLLPLGVGAASAQLRGHGGPVRALAVSPDGARAISGSFDSSAIRWSLKRNAAEQVLRFHDSAVNAVTFLKDGRIVTAGKDTRIAIWTPGKQEPDRVLEGHTAPIIALAASPDGKMVASASWDRTVRLWPLSGGEARVFKGHTDNANGVAFMPDGHALVSAGYDATVRIWPLAENGPPQIVTLPTPLNCLAVARDGEILTGGSNGKIYFLSPRGNPRGEVEAGETAVISVTVSRDGKLAAGAGVRGSVAIIERASRTLTRTLVGPGLPVWSVAFLPDNRTLMTGGTDRMVRRWNAVSGEHIGSVALNDIEDPLAKYAGERGAEVFRACTACHTLTPDEGNRAGPTLYGLFGRRIATLPGYRFSKALTKLDIVWGPETVSRLFEIGPAEYTPGTKMPQQTINSAEDRKALVEFLARATAKQK